ncbi:MAG: riboflavin biosynthesis protein RibF [Clostridia bacterium]|nr:riboflavin biosynthesis protein RibF [Clostridia bacterium]
MEILRLNEKSEGEKAICLGLFDSMHQGHLAVFSHTLSLASRMGLTPACFTLTGSVKGGNVYAEEERFRFMQKTGVSACITAPFNAELQSLSGEEFLNILVKNHSARAFIVGEDYRYGKNAAWNVTHLTAYAKANGIAVDILSDVLYDGEKIATGRIKTALTKGDIQRANALLGRPYSVMGKVMEGRRVGRTMGFPTANLSVTEQTFLKPGVYATACVLSGTCYTAVTNVGSAPTFGCEKPLIETYIHGFSGDLYGKNLRVYFIDYLREISPFPSAEQLIKQINQDKITAQTLVTAGEKARVMEIER